MLKLAALIVGAGCLIATSPSYADCDLGDVVGYTLIAQKTVSGFVDLKKQKRSDNYEGCDYDRVLLFNDGSGVKCTSYSYHYAYNPDAFIFARGNIMKACIDDDFVDVVALR